MRWRVIEIGQEDLNQICCSEEVSWQWRFGVSIAENLSTNEVD